jgi:RHS repeat-associated protein
MSDSGKYRARQNYFLIFSQEATMKLQNLFQNLDLLKRSFLFGLIFGLSVIFSVSVAKSQDLDHKADRNLKSSARVNPSTLAMEFSLPIGSYPGRAGNALPITFNYSSKIWNLKYVNTLVKEIGAFEPGNPPLTVERFISNNSILEYAERTTGGWTSSMQPPAILGVPEIEIFDEAGGQYDFITPNTSPNLPRDVAHWVKRIRVQLSDGSTHELRLSDSAVDCSLYPQECFVINNGTYLSTDGSRLKLVIGEPQPDQQTRNVLYTPDGGRYFFPAQTTTALNTVSIHTFAEYYIDRHGNKTTFNYNGTNRTWTDTLGKSLTDPLPNGILFQNPIVGTQSFQLPGISSPLSYSIKWKALKPLGCDTGTETACEESALEDPSDDLKYAGQDTCHWPHIDTPLTPSLFSGGTTTTNIITVGDQREREIYKDRVCAANPPVDVPDDNTTPPSVPIFDYALLAEVNLPDGSKYEFKYNIFGEITKIIYPTGGYERFRYESIPALSDSASPTNRGVVERWVSVDGVTESQHWQYAYSIEPTGGSPVYWTLVTTTAPDETQTQRYLHRTFSSTPFGFDNPLNGMPFEERVLSAPDPVSGQRKLLRRKLTEWTTSDPRSGGHASARRHPRPWREVTIILEDGSNSALVSMTENEYGDEQTYSGTPEYFADLNVTEVKTYHYKTVATSTAEATTTGPSSIDYFKNLFSSSDLAVVRETDYLYDSNYKARNINGLITEIRIKDALGNVKAKSQMAYDESTYLEGASISNAPGWENPGSSYRGLPTTVRRWKDISTNQYIETHTSFDQFGNPRKIWDGKGNYSEVQYTDNYTDSVNRNSYALPTKNIAYSGNSGTGTVFETFVKYDFNTGLVRYTTDVNNQTSEIQYSDPLLRPTKTIAPNGQQKITEYGAGTSASTRFVKVKTQLDASNWKENYTWFDGLGKTIKTQSPDAQGDVITEIEYDNMGRIKRKTSPYRLGTPENQKLWTQTVYDDLGTEKEVITPDGAKFTNEHGVSATGDSTGQVVTTIDQAGKKRRSITDALGNLIRVDEPDDYNNLGAISSPTHPTYYQYNVLGNIKQITQDQQTRTFQYDSLGRLNQSTNPESGTVTQKYDANSNITEIKDARNITTTIAYDALNRIISKSYSDSTPAVNFYYDDTNTTNSKGRLTRVDNGVSVTETTGFDAAGNVLSNRQIIDGQTYSMSYAYNLAGILTEQTYPSTRVVKNVLDADGDLSIVESKANTNSIFRTYANSFAFTPSGGVSRIKLGNGKWESYSFNERLQVSSVSLGNSHGGAELLKIDYAYGTTDNNGNLKSQTVTVPTIGTTQGFSAIQEYTYDSLNRLKTAEEKVNNSQTWKQTFSYDRYGNRRFVKSGTTTLPPSCAPQCNPQINTSNNNRIDDNQGFEYDASGKITKNANNQRLTYNAEGKITEVRDATTNALVVTFVYDGNGKRVKKIVGNQTTVFVYDVNGKAVAEYTVNISAAQNPAISYLTTDNLGTPRVITDQFGAVTSRRDFMPFGEQIYAGVGGRTTNQGYMFGDNIRNKFGGQIRDEETSMDYFDARNYDYYLGRFSSADNFGGKLANPQTLNLYAYVLNNPLKWIDPSGHMAEKPGGDGDCGTEDDPHPCSEEYDIPISTVRDCEASNTCNRDLPPSYNDLIPVYGNLRRAIWNMKSDGGANVGRSLGYFALTALDLAGVGSAAKAVSAAPTIVRQASQVLSREALRETLSSGRNVWNATQQAVRNVGAAADDAARTANCFVRGTLITTLAGLVAIEDIRAGDKVLSYDEDTGGLEYQEVVRLFRNTADVFLKIQIEGESEPIQVTLGHPFFVNRTRSDLSNSDDGDWILSKSLKVGDLLKDKTGEWKPIVSIEKVDETLLTYNFEVADNNNYFVGENGWLVHNQSLIDDVIDETANAAINGQKNITSKTTLTTDELLTAGEKFLGSGYSEIGKSGSGVFRSADGLRQFRIDSGSISGAHRPNVPHGHFQLFTIDNVPLVNNHVPFTP